MPVILVFIFVPGMDFAAKARVVADSARRQVRR
jgi:hypothetical protein